MIGEVIANTNVIRYLMAAMGILGVIAKLVNQVTLNRLIRAAGTMSKSTHRLIKLVKAKYEHACMVHDTVENTDAFVEKYIYEYRGFLFKIHTWRQIEILTVWFSGILALSGASADYLYYGAVESVYQYIAVGAAEQKKKKDRLLRDGNRMDRHSFSNVIVTKADERGKGCIIRLLIVL